MTQTNSPAIDITQDLSDLCFALVFLEEIVFNPGYQVVLEAALDNLVEDVGSKELMYVGPREVVCERVE
jgi:hypothetical protein